MFHRVILGSLYRETPDKIHKALARERSPLGQLASLIVVEIKCQSVYAVGVHGIPPFHLCLRFNQHCDGSARLLYQKNVPVPVLVSLAKDGSRHSLIG